MTLEEWNARDRDLQALVAEWRTPDGRDLRPQHVKDHMHVMTAQLERSKP